jgi:hypothetical protein
MYLEINTWKFDLNKNLDEIELENSIELESINNLKLIKNEEDQDFKNYQKNDTSASQIMRMVAEGGPKFFKFNNSKAIIKSSSIGDAMTGTILRIEIPRDCNPNTILNKYANVELDYQIGGDTINKAPLKIFYYLCEKFGRSIEVVDGNILSNKNNKAKIYKQNNAVISQRYYFENPNGLYLDIPIIFEDFSYSYIHSTVTNKYHDVTYTLKSSSIIKESCYIIYDNMMYFDTNPRRNLINSGESEKLSNTINFKQLNASQNININMSMEAKFFFLIMEKKKIRV